MGKTSIEWTSTYNADGTVTPGKTWNPLRGCSRISPGCANCYAEKIAARFSDPGEPFHTFAERTPRPHWTGKVELIEDKLLEPLSWRKPCRCFVNSMSDLFHEDLPDSDRDRIFAVMALCPHITFQLLTKRADRMERYLTAIRSDGVTSGIISDYYGRPARFFPRACKRLFNREDIMPWPLPNVWLGVSVENQEQADARIPHLLRTPAAVRFLSCEPLLGPVDLLSMPRVGQHWDYLTGEKQNGGGKEHTRGIDWVIVGGESGPGARSCNVEWVRSIVRQCRDAGVACFPAHLPLDEQGGVIVYFVMSTG